MIKLKEIICENNVLFSEGYLKQQIEKGLKTEYIDSGANDFDNPVEEVLKDFYEVLSLQFPKGLANIPDQPTLYRFVTLNNPKELNKASLGRSWFADLDAIEYGNFSDQLNHIFKSNDRGTKKAYLIEAKVPLNNINFIDTLWMRSLNSSENEVVVNKYNGIKILNVYEYNKIRIKNGKIISK